MKKNSVIVVFLLVVAAVLVICSFTVKGTTYEQKKITVQSGDTLWEYADRYGNGMDKRKYVYEVKKLNGMESGSLRAGDTIYVLEVTE